MTDTASVATGAGFGLSLSVPAPRTVDTVARMAGRWVSLRPLMAGDHDFLYRIAVDPRMIMRWRLRGTTPAPEQFPHLLWQNVLAQFVVERASDHMAIGTVTAYNADHRNQIVYLAVAIVPEFEKTGWVLESVAVFVEYLFRCWDFRKIYVEAVEFNFAEYSSGLGRFFELEGCLRDREYFDGEYWHVYIAALHRDNWPDIARRLGRQLPLDHQG